MLLGAVGPSLPLMTQRATTDRTRLGTGRFRCPYRRLSADIRAYLRVDGVRLKTNDTAIQSQEMADSERQVVAIHTREVAGSIPAAPIGEKPCSGAASRARSPGY
jgi:hypothetical protein